ncbi:hypothetical protein Oweho_3219 [Owenweeksia hongkongensis DSM 17368]|uniref:Uncharacterized protein n=1 Tax=Owenweeksia hongkongensis (strain DSM 17368 / CIP 108786 / JCM 12287 / NRRL B-23963 / UST20020801) TaxID=926562 RepID=G8R3T3_OWEHD|nr:hypothetical protein [Owenweeksia hongkongensis]AEV34170.1 hypothetical protein Oweho_3219 [Owenweeksia hongkongensis DSM 17368]
MNPILQLILNRLGQIGAIHIGPTEPDNPLLLWAKTNATTGQLIGWLDHTKGYWGPLAQVEVVDNFNSSSTTKAASARTVKVLFDYLNQLNVLQNDYVQKSTANQPGGYGLILPNGKLDPSIIDFDGSPAKGVWDASAGSPPSANPSNQDYWIVKVAGTYNLNGINSWAVSDRVLYINNAWEKIPAAAVNTYNALDQTNPGYQLDARQGKALYDLIVALTARVVVLETDLATAKSNITDLQNNKQDKGFRIRSVVTSDEFDDARLEDIDIDSCDVFVNGERMVGAMMAKAFSDTTITFPHTQYDGNEIVITRIPQ